MESGGGAVDVGLKQASQKRKPTVSEEHKLQLHYNTSYSGFTLLQHAGEALIRARGMKIA